MMTVNLGCKPIKGKNSSDPAVISRREFEAAFSSSSPEIVCVQELRPASKCPYSDEHTLATTLKANYLGEKPRNHINGWEYAIDWKTTIANEQNVAQGSRPGEAALFWNTGSWVLGEKHPELLMLLAQSETRNKLHHDELRERIALACLDELGEGSGKTGKTILAGSYHGRFNQIASRDKVSPANRLVLLKDLKDISECIAYLAETLGIRAIIGGDFNFEINDSEIRDLQPPPPHSDAAPPYSVEIIGPQRPHTMKNGGIDRFMIITPLSMHSRPVIRIVPRYIEYGDQDASRFDHRPVVMSFKLSGSPEVHLVKGDSTEELRDFHEEQVNLRQMNTRLSNVEEMVRSLLNGRSLSSVPAGNLVGGGTNANARPSNLIDNGQTRSLERDENVHMVDLSKEADDRNPLEVPIQDGNAGVGADPMENGKRAHETLSSFEDEPGSSKRVRVQEQLDELPQQQATATIRVASLAAPVDHADLSGPSERDLSSLLDAAKRLHGLGKGQWGPGKSGLGGILQKWTKDREENTYKFTYCPAEGSSRNFKRWETKPDNIFGDFGLTPKAQLIELANKLNDGQFRDLLLEIQETYNDNRNIVVGNPQVGSPQPNATPLGAQQQTVNGPRDSIGKLLEKAKFEKVDDDIYKLLETFTINWKVYNGVRKKEFIDADGTRAGDTANRAIAYAKKKLNKS